MRSAFERLASQIVVLGPDQFIYGFRENRQVPPKEFVPVREFTQFLEDGNWTKSDFLPLLKHNDAKVRTLALIALYNLDDPQVLPDIFPLVTDQASTFVATEPDRTWTLLRLNDDTGSDVLVPHEELVRLLKDRGPDSLMELLIPGPVRRRGTTRVGLRALEAKWGKPGAVGCRLGLRRTAETYGLRAEHVRKNAEDQRAP